VLRKRFGRRVLRKIFGRRVLRKIFGPKWMELESRLEESA
jgi:hypothetical protein